MTYRNAREALEARRDALGAELSDLRTQAATLADLDQRITVLQRSFDTAEQDLNGLPLRKSPLEDVRVATPCKANWDAMQGDDQVRFCGQCRKNVFNLSAMTRDEAEGLLASHNESMCIRLYRRADGTVLTADCPVGVRRKNTRRVALVIVGSGAVAAAATLASAFTVMGEPAVRTPVSAIAPPIGGPVAVQGGAAPLPEIRPTEMGEAPPPHRLLEPVQGHMSRPMTHDARGPHSSRR